MENITYVCILYIYTNIQYAVLNTKYTPVIVFIY